MAPSLKVLVLTAALSCMAGVAQGQSAGERVDVGGMRFEALPAQSLSAGRCGLFLWSRSDRPVFILFATENPAEATVRLDGRTRHLKRQQTSGDPVLGHFEKQTFSGDRYAFQIDLTYDRSKPVKDGAVIDRGVLRTRDKNGFETILPVGGMIGCKKA